ncbi:MAG: cytochrome P450 family protein [Sporichthyaceae bacterium]
MPATRNPVLDSWGGAGFDRDNPFPLFDEVLAQAPIHEITLADGHKAILILGYAQARAALNNPDLSKDMHAALDSDGAVFDEGLPGRDYARHMLSVDPPDHTRLRGLSSSAFKKSRLTSLEPRIVEAVEELLAALEACSADVVDLVETFAAPLPFTVLGELMGMAKQDQARLAGYFEILLKPGSGPSNPEAVAASNGITGYLEALVDQRWADPTDDLVGDLVVAAEGGALTKQELRSTLFQLLVAGHHTTTSLIGNGVVALLLHPEQRDALVADPTLVPRAVEEFMRYDAPVPHSTFRYASKDVTIDGVTIPAGTQVIVSLAAAGRDPAKYNDPQAFDVHRPDVSHMAFGFGIHHCLGAALARLEGKIAFEALLARFPQMELAVPVSELRWDHGDGLVLRGLTNLPIRLRP